MFYSNERCAAATDQQVSDNYCEVRRPPITAKPVTVMFISNVYFSVAFWNASQILLELIKGVPTIPLSVEVIQSSSGNADTYRRV